MIIEESQISKAIHEATVEIVGDGTDVSNTPLTLLVKKKDIPDLTIIDLPGIHNWVSNGRYLFLVK